MTDPVFYLLCGVPGSGKSTWVSSQPWDTKTTVVVSSDAVIERWAAQQHTTYSEIFDRAIGPAVAQMQSEFSAAVAKNLSVVWDQTNLTVKSRRSRLAQVPQHYRRVAVWFPTPPADLLTQRLAARPGKIIPAKLLQTMIATAVQPQISEGFDQVRVVQTHV